MTHLSVSKWQGTGNDFVLLDARTLQSPVPSYATLARNLCHRRFGIGADGLLVLEPARDPHAAVRMRIFNADGSEAEMCGNGIRCVARHLNIAEPKRAAFSIETQAGLMQTDIVSVAGDDLVRVAMGAPAFIGPPPGALPKSLHDHNMHAYGVSFGNPHVVIETTSDLARSDLAHLASLVDGWHVFSSQPNVELVRYDGDALQMRVHERGVGETWACGTGACAVAVVAIAGCRAQSPVTVITKGGRVSVEWQGPGTAATLCGAAEFVFETTVNMLREAQSVP